MVRSRRDAGYGQGEHESVISELTILQRLEEFVGLFSLDHIGHHVAKVRKWLTTQAPIDIVDNPDLLTGLFSVIPKLGFALLKRGDIVYSQDVNEITRFLVVAVSFLTPKAFDNEIWVWFDFVRKALSPGIALNRSNDDLVDMCLPLGNDRYNDVGRIRGAVVEALHAERFVDRVISVMEAVADINGCGDNVQGACSRPPPPKVKILLQIVTRMPQIFDIHYFPETALNGADVAARLKKALEIYLGTLTDEEFKFDERDCHRTLWESIGSFLRDYAPDKSEQWQDEVELTLALANFRSSHLERRMAGLSDIVKAVSYPLSVVHRSEEIWGRARSRNEIEFMVKWLREHNILQLLFGPNLRVELIKKCSDVVRFLTLAEGGFARDDMSLIWHATTDRVETERLAVHVMIIELVKPGFSLDILAYLFELIGVPGVTSFDTHTVEFVYKLTWAAAALRDERNYINTSMPTTPDAVMVDSPTTAMGTDVNMSHSMSSSCLPHSPGVQLLLSAVFEAPFNGASTAQSRLSDLLGNAPFFSERVDTANRCLHYIKDSPTSLLPIMLLYHINQSLRLAASQTNMQQLSHWSTLTASEEADVCLVKLELEQAKFIDVMLFSLTSYKAAAKRGIDMLRRADIIVDDDDAGSKGTPIGGGGDSSWHDCILDNGNFTHKLQIEQRLQCLFDFYYFGLECFPSSDADTTSTPNRSIGVDVARALWREGVTGAITPQELAHFCDWFAGVASFSQVCPRTVISGMPSALEDCLVHWRFTCFNEDARSVIFAELFRDLDAALFSPLVLKAYVALFLHFNFKANHICILSAPSSLVVMSMPADFLGLDVLWGVLLRASDVDVVSTARDFLTQLFLCVPENRVREAFVIDAMSRLETAAKVSSVSDNAGPDVLSRCLALLRSYVDVFARKHGAALRACGVHSHMSRGSPITLRVAIHQTGIISNVPTTEKLTLTTHSNTLLCEVHDALQRLVKNVLGFSPDDESIELRFVVGGKTLTPSTDSFCERFPASIGNALAVIAVLRSIPDSPQKGQGNPKSTTSVESCLGQSKVGTKNFEGWPAEDIASAPTSILSRRENFERLSELLRMPGYALPVWSLLMLLPTNADVLSRLRAIGDDSMTNVTIDAESECAQLLPPENPFSLMYSLQIVETLARGGEGAPDRWLETFTLRGGVRHLIRCVVIADLQSESGLSGSAELKKACQALLLNLTNSFLLSRSAEVVGATLRDIAWPTDVDIAVLVRRLIDISWRAGAPFNTENSSASKGGLAAVTLSEDGKQRISNVNATTCVATTCGDADVAAEVVSQAMDLLCALHHDDTHGNAVAVAVTSFSQFDDWLRILTMESPIASVRSAACTRFHQLAISWGRRKVLDHLIEALSALPSRHSTCREFFRWFLALFGTITNGESEETLSLSDYSHLFKLLLRRIGSHPILERHELVLDVDEVLTGLLQVASAVVGRCPFLRATDDGLQMLNEVFHRCLFDVPSAESHGADIPPLCKSSESRNAAFYLLVNLSRDKEGISHNLPVLLQLFLKHHQCGTHFKTPFSYLPSEVAKASCGYVGLKNLGCTCYMNSFLQQLFMIPAFRAGILSAPVSVAEGETINDSLLFQLQRLFTYLQESANKSYVPTSFIQAYKQFGGEPVNVAVQMDVDEFCVQLFQQLEDALKGSPVAELMNSIFQVQLVNQIISLECEHTSQREEVVFALQINVKNTTSVLEGLEQYVQGDPLDGDNKYHCELCGVKVAATKRVCLGNLPETLVLHLKRFEFDMELLRRWKCNDYVQFPNFLDMEPYTAEGLARSEAVKNGEIPSPTSRPSLYFDYKLAGIVVHTGTTEMGHYYSFVRERQGLQEGEAGTRWLSFNDSLVENFDPSRIPECAFGGSESVERWDQSQCKSVRFQQAKAYSAYLVVYERCTEPPPRGNSGYGGTMQASCTTSPLISPRQTGDTSMSIVRAENLATSRMYSPAELSKLVPSDIRLNIWEDNELFWRESHVFRAEYANTLLTLCSIVLPNDEERFVSIDPDLRLLAVHTAAHAFLDTLIHGKDRMIIERWLVFLRREFGRSVEACQWLLGFTASHPHWLKRGLFDCTVKSSREAVMCLFANVMETVRTEEELSLYDEELTNEVTSDYRNCVKSVVEEDEDEQDDIILKPFTGSVSASVLLRFGDRLYRMMEGASEFWRHFEQYWSLLLRFLDLGGAECRYILNRYDAVYQLIDFYFWSGGKGIGTLSPRASGSIGKRHSDMFSVDTGSVAAVSMSSDDSMAGGELLHITMGDKFSQPDLSGLAECIRLLLLVCDFSCLILPDPDIESMDSDNGGLNYVPLSASACYAVLFSRTETVEKMEIIWRLLSLATTPEYRVTMGNVIEHMCECDSQGTIVELLMNAVCGGIAEDAVDQHDPYFEAIGVMVKMPAHSKLEIERRALCIYELLVEAMEKNTEFPKETERCLQLLATISSEEFSDNGVPIAIADCLREQLSNFASIFLVRAPDESSREETRYLIMNILNRVEDRIDALRSLIELVELEVAYFMPQWEKRQFVQSHGHAHRHMRVDAYHRQLVQLIVVIRDLALTTSGDRVRDEICNILVRSTKILFNSYIKVDHLKVEADSTKSALLALFQSTSMLFPSVAKEFATVDHVGRLMSNFVSLNLRDIQLTTFNERHLGVFYSFLHTLCMTQPSLAAIIGGHENLIWAIRNFMLMTRTYPRVANDVNTLFGLVVSQGEVAVVNSLLMMYAEAETILSPTRPSFACRVLDTMLQEAGNESVNIALSIFRPPILTRLIACVVNHSNLHCRQVAWPAIHTLSRALRIIMDHDRLSAASASWDIDDMVILSDSLVGTFNKHMPFEERIKAMDVLAMILRCSEPLRSRFINNTLIRHVSYDDDEDSLKGFSTFDSLVTNNDPASVSTIISDSDRAICAVRVGFCGRVPPIVPAEVRDALASFLKPYHDVVFDVLSVQLFSSDLESCHAAGEASSVVGSEMAAVGDFRVASLWNRFLSKLNANCSVVLASSHLQAYLNSIFYIVIEGGDISAEAASGLGLIFRYIGSELVELPDMLRLVETVSSTAISNLDMARAWLQKHVLEGGCDDECARHEWNNSTSRALISALRILSVILSSPPWRNHVIVPPDVSSVLDTCTHAWMTTASDEGANSENNGTLHGISRTLFTLGGFDVEANAFSALKQSCVVNIDNDNSGNIDADSSNVSETTTNGIKLI